ncbi:MAG: hypothetical protein PWP27_1815 [Clostridiales bacterium]|jgi:hypothetical protein|nr:hypothetical protein [Clostridiales bacterium]
MLIITVIHSTECRDSLLTFGDINNRIVKTNSILITVLTQKLKIESYQYF